MKKGTKQSTILPKLFDLKSNSIGNKENDKAREKAKELINKIQNNG